MLNHLHQGNQKQVESQLKSIQEAAIKNQNIFVNQHYVFKK